MLPIRIATIPLSYVSLPPWVIFPTLTGNYRSANSLPQETGDWSEEAGAWQTLVQLLVRANKYMGFPGSSDGKESTFNAGDPGLILEVGKIPWRREWQPTPVFFPGEFHGQRGLVGYSPGVAKSRTQFRNWTTTTKMRRGIKRTLWEKWRNFKTIGLLFYITYSNPFCLY